MAPVQLYVYDLSNGVAAQLSRQLTGRQIDGIWHTSVVVFGKEVFYGQGISITAPGCSHHGQPLKTLDMGDTALDEETFEEYLAEMRLHYTADKYHLLDFNCNSFTNDCVGFLTGGSIPSWIKDLPSDFLSTPFGAMLRPTIDAMYRRPVPGAATAQPAPPATSALASSLLQAVSSRATAPESPSQALAAAIPSPLGASTPSTATVAAPIHVSTNAASFKSTVSAHRATVALFTSATCPPCRVIAPTFEDLAREKTRTRRSSGDVAFVKVDIDVGVGASALAAEYGVRATPTFLFFLDGKKTAEVKGADARELQTQVDLLLYEAFPPHKHASLSSPAVETISLDPILFTQTPALDTVQTKLLSTISSISPPFPSATTAALRDTIIPWLKTGRPSPAPAEAFTTTATTLVRGLPIDALFPFLDLWRLAVLDCTVATASTAPLLELLALVDASGAGASRATLLTALRLLANMLGRETGQVAKVLSDGHAVGVLAQAVLHTDRLVRVAAASTAFNVAAWVQRARVAKVRGEDVAVDVEDVEREVEIVSAVVQAIGNEEESEDVYHRLVATLALLLRLSPHLEDSTVPLLEVLQAKEAVLGKLSKESKLQVKKPDARDLAREVTQKLCGY